METENLVAQKVQELITFLANLPPADSQADNIDRIHHIEEAKRAYAQFRPMQPITSSNNAPLKKPTPKSPPPCTSKASRPRWA